MFKACKFSLFDSQKTDHLNDDDDEQPDLACTSQLQRWDRKAMVTISPLCRIPRANFYLSLPFMYAN